MVLGIKERLVECATVCVKSVVILLMYIGALNKIPRMGSLSGYIIDLVQLFSYLGSDFDSDFMNFALAMIFLFFSFFVGLRPI